MPDETMRAELAPCPFCGRTDLLGIEEADRGFLVVTCRACGAKSGCARSETPQEAIAAWNRRASAAPAVDYWEPGLHRTKIPAPPRPPRPSDAGKRALLQRAANSLQDVTQILDMVLAVSGGYPEDADGPAVEARATVAALRAAISESEGSSNA